MSRISNPSAEAAVHPRIGSGMPAAVPNAKLPLFFFVLSAIALSTDGVVATWNARSIASHPGGHLALGVVHLFMLGFLTTGVFGALHQFAPVIASRKLRSERVGVISAGIFSLGALGLGTSFLFNFNPGVAASGALAVVGIAMVVWNLSAPLLASGKGVPISGLRFAAFFLLAVALFGLSYAFDRNGGEKTFALNPNLVLAHAHIGLIGWLGLTYIAVAEKLWPMFMLSHRTKRTTAHLALWTIPLGLLILVIGMLTAITHLAELGALLIIVGLATHVFALFQVVAARKRKLELLAAYIFASEAFLVTAVALAIAAWANPPASALRANLAAGEVAALGAWIALAFIGHSHKVVPFISWGLLRQSGITKASNGRPLLFSDLLNRGVARAGFGVLTAAFALVVAGLATRDALAFRGGAILTLLGAVITTLNLSVRPRRLKEAFID